MTPDDLSRYRALSARDARFDGVFFVGVTSTGIYCRPVCPARTPAAARCRFFDNAGAAEKAGFRPCLRCRPELAPGSAPVDDAGRIAHLIIARLEENAPGEEPGLEQIADEFELSSRQIRRIVQQQFGVSPIELLQTRRLLRAKQLLTESSLPIAQVATACGFASVRRFHAAFGDCYGMPPTRLRLDAQWTGSARDADPFITLQLAYRPPYNWTGLLSFLRDRTLTGVEAVEGDEYLRTVQLGTCTGWVRVRHAPARRALLADIPHSLVPVLPALLERLRNLFDLSARPDVIGAHLRRDPRLARLVARNPGLRVPGAFDGFELALRAILGQQVTVRAATTLAGRFVERYGGPTEMPFAALRRLAPTPEIVARANPEDIASLLIIRTRAQAMVALAREVAEGRIRLGGGARPEATMGQLTALPGIGPWTAHYIAMRALRWPDAFPKEDIAVRKALGRATAAQAEAESQAWRPWRSYATLHLWRAG